MKILSFIVLILLSLVGYSGGAAGKAGKSADLKPRIIDLILVVIIWTGAIYSRTSFELDKWILILIWVILSIILGVLAISFRKLSEEKSPNDKEPIKTPANLFKKLWHSWKDFSQRMGNFQSRILLSLFFFIFISPFALAVKVFSDPLNLKNNSKKSQWLPKKEIKDELEQYRRQF